MIVSVLFKRYFLHLLALAMLAWLAAAWSNSQAVRAGEQTALLFVENVGQFPDARSRFQANLERMTLHLAGDGLWLTLVEETGGDGLAERQGVNLKLSFANANPAPRLEPFNPVETRLSYFTSRDPAAWRVDAPAWGGVRYVELYPGLDLEVTTAGGRLAQRLVAREAGAASLAAVRLQVEGAEAVRLDETGRLRLDTAIGPVSLPLLEVVDAAYRPLAAPLAPEVVGAGTVAAPFAPPGETAGIFQRTDMADEFSLAAPAAAAADLLYSTFLGGSAGGEEGRAIAVDPAGYAYVVGQTISDDFPTTPGAFDTSVDGGDAFVAKLNPAGTELVYATFIGGGRGFAIAVDETGSAYVGGDTFSDEFPVTPGAASPDYGGNGDAFILKLSPDGTALVYATYLGGSGSELGFGLAVDSLGQAYAAGFTSSADFPATPGAFDPDHDGGGLFGQDAFAAKLNADGTAWLYATFIGGDDNDVANAIAVDEAGSAYLTGQTDSADFPVTPGAFETSFRRAFAAKLSTDGAELVYATFLGGNGNDVGRAIAVDSAGQAFVAGDTTSDNFPTTPGAFQTEAHTSADITHLGDAFVVKFNAAGSDLVYATYVGGSDHDNGFGLAVDPAGQAYLTGGTYSSDFPTTPDAFQPGLGGYPDAFVTVLNEAGSGLVYGTYLGGQFGETGYAISAGADGEVFVTGYTGSPDFPVSDPAFSAERQGGQDAFVTRLAAAGGGEPPVPPLPAQSCAPTLLGQATVGDQPRGVAVDPERSRVYVANFGSNSVSIIDGATNQLLHTVAGVIGANGLAYDPSHNIVWVSNYSLNQLTPIQAAESPAGAAALPAIPVGQGPWGVVYDPVHDYVYVANSLDHTVSVVDASTRSLAATLSGAFNRPFHLAANPANGKVYVANNGQNSVTVVDGTAVSKVTPLYDSGRAYGIAVDETRNVIYVATVETNRIVALGPLNGQPDQFLGWASFQRGYNHSRRLPLRVIGVNPEVGPAFDGGHVWTTTSTGDGSEANQALFIPKGWSSRFHVPFAQAVGSNPTEGIAIDRSADRVYVTSGGSPGLLTVLGDHDAVCGGIAPAEAAQENETIRLELYAVEEISLSDLNGDGLVDIVDLSIVAAHYGSAEAAADLNGDGLVDILDLTLVASNYGQRLPEE